MQILNNSKDYGLIAILLHWVMAVLTFGLFFLGEYMVDLDYYDPWYQKAPDLHRSLGVVVGLFLLVRLLWRLINALPEIPGKSWERMIALWVHRLFYALVAGAVISGYLISTADGQGIDVFGWIEVPPLYSGWDNQEDVAGEVHEVMTHMLFFLALLHGLAALKNHFIDRDATLLRMLGLGAKRSSSKPTNNL